MHNVFLKVRQTHAILTYVTRARVFSGGLVPKTFVSQVATWTRSTKLENDFSYSCKFRLREREKREKERETAASDRNKSASSRCNAKRMRSRCIDACANIMRVSDGLMPAICGYCCYLTVTLWAASAMLGIEKKQGTGVDRRAATHERDQNWRFSVVYLNINTVLLEKSTIHRVINLIGNARATCCI